MRSCKTKLNICFRALAVATFAILAPNAWATAPDFSWLKYSEVATQKNNIIFLGSEFLEVGWIGFNGPVKKEAKCLIGPGFAVHRLYDVNEGFIGGTLVRDSEIQNRAEYKSLPEAVKRQVCPPTTKRQNIYIEIPLGLTTGTKALWRVVR